MNIGDDLFLPASVVGALLILVGREANAVNNIFAVINKLNVKED